MSEPREDEQYPPPWKVRAASTIYGVWRNMLSRCRNPNGPHYANYGGRGIKVCARWTVFKNFVEDMVAPAAGYSLDRIDNDGDYEPGNCRWVSRAEQNRNTRRNVWVTVGGERLCIKDACLKIGHTFQAFRHLQKSRGWDAQRVVDEWASKRVDGRSLLPRAAP